MNGKLFYVCCFYVLSVLELNEGLEEIKQEVDKVIENEITQRLSEDLLQSIEKKFQVDLEKSVDMVLVKIKLLLQNGTTHIQDRLEELENQLIGMKKDGEKQVNNCLNNSGNRTAALAEKALHQMVVCGYALIGHDPAQAVRNVMELKNMIGDGMKAIYKQKEEVYGLLRVCGHEHDSLKKVIKCVISKSPIIKSAMMDITSKLIEGVVKLTKLMAHGAMHEACLIEVIKTVEDEAFEIINSVKICTSNITDDQPAITNKDNVENTKNVNELLKKMLTDNQNIGDQYKDKLLKLQQQLDTEKNENTLTNDPANKD